VCLWNGFLGLLLLAFCANGTWAHAQDDFAAPRKTNFVEPQQKQSPQVLVLKSGRVFKGHIVPRGNGYDVDQANGRIFISSEQVWLLAKSIPDAHETMRESFSTLTPDVHMQIAAWCSNNQLWGTARRELLDALHKDPYRQDARRMLANVVRQQEAKNRPAESAGSKAIREVIAAKTAFSRRSLGGLPKELARNFTHQIQPLLSNKCSQCHQSDSGRGFVFESIRKGTNRTITERNLRAVLSQMESSTTSRGDFLSVARSKHGQMSSAPFSGRLGDIQRDRLSIWLEQTSLEKGFSSARTLASAEGDSGITLVRHQSQPNDDSTIMPDRGPHEDSRSIETINAELLADAKRRNREDKFDPEIFNQRYRLRGASVDADFESSNRRSP
jgi:hypothetical protein